MALPVTILIDALDAIFKADAGVAVFFDDVTKVIFKEENTIDLNRHRPYINILNVTGTRFQESPHKRELQIPIIVGIYYDEKLENQQEYSGLMDAVINAIHNNWKITSGADVAKALNDFGWAREYDFENGLITINISVTYEYTQNK